MTLRAIAIVSLRSPELYAGWPQQVWASGTSTAQPASSRSLTAAKPTLGRMRSTRQVTKRPTRSLGDNMPRSLEMVEASYARATAEPQGGGVEGRVLRNPTSPLAGYHMHTSRTRG